MIPMGVLDQPLNTALHNTAWHDTQIHRQYTLHWTRAHKHRSNARHVPPTLHNKYTTTWHANCSNVKMRYQYTNVQQIRLVSVLQNNVLTFMNIIKSSTRRYVLLKQHYLQISIQNQFQKKTLERTLLVTTRTVAIRKYTTVLNTYTH